MPNMLSNNKKYSSLPCNMMCNMICNMSCIIPRVKRCLVDTRVHSDSHLNPLNPFSIRYVFSMKQLAGRTRFKFPMNVRYCAAIETNINGIHLRKDSFQWPRPPQNRKVPLNPGYNLNIYSNYVCLKMRFLKQITSSVLREQYPSQVSSNSR